MPFALTLRIFLPFALGYFLASIFRSIYAVIAPDLVRELSLSATEMGFAISAFFLCATFFQIPYGILLDRYDPRRLYAVCLVLCALGAVFVAVAQGAVLLTLGRAFIALGASASAVTSYKIYSLWYPPERLPLANGLSLAAGGLGLMTGTAPVAALLQVTDWRTVHLIVAGALVLSSLIVLIVAPAKETRRSGVPFFQLIKGLGAICTNLVFWRVAPMMMISVGSFGALPSLWTGPWLRDVAGLSGAEASTLLLVLTGALTLSGLLTGAITALAKRAGIAPIGLAVITAGLVGLVLFVFYLQWTPSPVAVMATWALYGFIAPLNFVLYAALGPQFPAGLTGRLNACLTLSWMLGAFLIQNIYGVALDRFPTTNGSYAIEGHQMGMGIIVVLLVAAILWFFACTLVLRVRRRDAAPDTEILPD